MSDRAKKKDRAYFTCPRWAEIAETPEAVAAGQTGTPVKILAAIQSGEPVARATLRKALVAVRQASGAMFDVEAYMVDKRAA